jgi:hypothetical protein
MRKFWKVTPAEVWAIAKERVQSLRARSFSELCALPSHESEVVRVGDQEVSVCTYRDMLPDGRVRIVVQAYRYRFLGAGTMTADGFIMSPDGAVSDVPEKMMYEFI